MLSPRGRQGGARRLRGDAHLRSLPTGALAADQDEQRHRAPEPRDSQAHPGGRDLPRRQERPHAGHRQAQVRRRQRMGLQKVSGRDASGGLIMPRSAAVGPKVRNYLDGTCSTGPSSHV
jgi:hypothetical protein